MRKNIIFGFATLLAVAITACSNDDYKYEAPSGSPVVTATQPADVLMGDELTITANCQETSGVALSTLKAELCFSGEVVNRKTVRTASPGDYTVTLNVPFKQYVPNGQATVRFTLQNVTTKTAVTEVPVNVERPHFTDLQFVDADGKTYPMAEGDDYNYSTTVSIANNGFKGHFQTADGKWLFGSNGAEVELGKDGNLEFLSATTGDVTVTFNTCDYSYGPQESIPVIPLTFSEADNVVTKDLVKGQPYSFVGIKDGWYTDPDFFIDNGDGSYTFNAIDGTYTIKAVYNQNGFRIHAGTAGSPLSLQPDGTGAVWIIGDAVYGKPTFAEAQNWWTDTDHALCMAPVAEKVYQVTFTIGQQLKGGNSTNFKFFGQAGWGIEFKDAGDYVLTTDNPWFIVNAGDGNIHLGDGVQLVNGETYVLTIDLTAGVKAGVLKVEKK